MKKALQLLAIVLIILIDAGSLFLSYIANFYLIPRLKKPESKLRSSASNAGAIRPIMSRGALIATRPAIDLNLAKMPDQDLAAIYADLKTFKPISNKIEKTFIKKYGG